MKALVLNRVALLLSFIGIFVSGVLSMAAIWAKSIPCGQDHGCDTVALHPSSRALFGIPNAYIGLVAYLVLAVFAYMRLVNPAASRKGLIVAYAMTAVGTLVSLLLTYVSIAVIHATCKWCLASAATMILLLVVHAVLMQTEPDADAQAPKISNGIVLAVLVFASLVGLAMQSVVLEQARNIGSDFEIKVADDVILPKDAHSYGNPDAPVTVVEFGDLLCPTCQNEYGKIKAYIGQHPGKIRYVLRHFPMNIKGHEQATAAAFASEIAAEKDRFWPYVDLMYSTVRIDMPDTGPILDVVQSLGMDRDAVLKRMESADKDDPAFKRLMRDISDASKIGIQGTPTFFILAKGVKSRPATLSSLYDDLERPEYKKLIGG